MANKSSWGALVVILVLIGGIGVGANSPRAEEMEKLLKKLNKPAIKTIESPDGDIIDCIDIYKQPAFDHPLLKNHTIEMRPGFSPEKGERGNYSEEFPEQIWRLHGSCPKGAIPIRRVLPSDLARSEFLESFGVVFPNPIVTRPGRSEFAAAEITRPQSFYNGISANIPVWRPTVEMFESSESMILVLDNINDRNYISAGWMVTPVLYQDNEPRLTVLYGTGNSPRACYNLMCPGFIQVNDQLVLGSRLTPSTSGGNIQKIRVQIRKKNEHSQWWVSINHVELGYYPFSVFSGFTRANKLMVLGSIHNTRNSGQHTSTQMGNGVFAIAGTRTSAHFEDIWYIDERNVFHPAQGLQVVANYPRCYNAVLSRPVSGAVGPTVFYGGPSGPRCDET